MSGCRDKQGLALVAVLWIVIVMIAIVAVVAQTGRLNMKMATATVDEIRCKWACRAGTEAAIAVLNEDPKDSDCLSDPWSDDDLDFNNVRLERCQYNVRVIDEAGKLNVNTATKEQLMALPYMDSQIADAILDWRDNDDNPEPEGAESGYYQNLPIPYKIRNGPFRTTRELLCVKGMTEQLLYGRDPNLNGQLTYHEMESDGQPTLDNDNTYLSQGLITYLTCYSYENNVDADGQNRVNMNQANEQQLQSQLGINAGQARWIVQNRGSGFKSIGDLVNDGSSKSSSGNSDSGSGDNSSSNPSSPNSSDSSGRPGNSGDSGGPGGRGNPGSSGNPNVQAQPIDLQTFSKIADKITISSESKIPGRINVNTAPEPVLTALFGGEDAGGRQIALAIIGERASRTYGFQSVAGLLSVPSVTISKFKTVADRITVRSNVFAIRCTGTAAISGAKVQSECVVDRSASPCTILYSYQGASY